MQRPPVLVPLTLFVSSLMWAGLLVFEKATIGTAAAGLLAVDLLVLTTIGVVGIILSRGRWTRRFTWVIIAIQVASSLTVPFDRIWFIGVLLTGLTVFSIAGPWLDGWLRHRPRPDGPPTRSILLVLGLMSMPAVVALGANTQLGWAAWILAAGSFAIGWAYSRALGVGLWSARLLLPVLTLLAVPFMPVKGAIVTGLSGLILTVLAWTGDAQLAVYPLDQRSIPVPPQLVPTEVLDAAGLDDRGRPKSRKGS